MKIESWIIWSIEHAAWWKANRRGYTQDVDEAGRYNTKEAVKICIGANIIGASIDGLYPKNRLPDEVMCPAPEEI